MKHIQALRKGNLVHLFVVKDGRVIDCFPPDFESNIEKAVRRVRIYHPDLDHVLTLNGEILDSGALSLSECVEISVFDPKA